MEIDAQTIDATNKFIVDQGVGVFALVVFAAMMLVFSAILWRALGYLRERDKMESERQKARQENEMARLKAETERLRADNAQQTQMLTVIDTLSTAVNSLRSLISQIEGRIAADRETDRDARAKDRNSLSAAISGNTSAIEGNNYTLEQINSSLETIKSTLVILPSVLEGMRETRSTDGVTLQTVLGAVEGLRQSVDILTSSLTQQPKLSPPESGKKKKSDVKQAPKEAKKSNEIENASPSVPALAGASPDGSSGSGGGKPQRHSR